MNDNYGPQDPQTQRMIYREPRDGSLLSDSYRRTIESNAEEAARAGVKSVNVIAPQKERMNYNAKWVAADVFFTAGLGTLIYTGVKGAKKMNASYGQRAAEEAYIEHAARGIEVKGYHPSPAAVEKMEHKRLELATRVPAEYRQPGPEERWELPLDAPASLRKVAEQRNQTFDFARRDPVAFAKKEKELSEKFDKMAQDVYRKEGKAHYQAEFLKEHAPDDFEHIQNQINKEYDKRYIEEFAKDSSIENDPARQEKLMRQAEQAVWPEMSARFEEAVKDVAAEQAYETIDGVPADRKSDLPGELGARYQQKNGWYHDVNEKPTKENRLFKFNKHGAVKIAQKPVTEETADALAKIAQSRGSTFVNLKGSAEYKRTMWLAMSLLDPPIKVNGFLPSEKDRELLEQKRAERQKNVISLNPPSQQRPTPPPQAFGPPPAYGVPGGPPPPVQGGAGQRPPMQGGGGQRPPTPSNEPDFGKRPGPPPPPSAKQPVQLEPLPGMRPTIIDNGLMSPAPTPPSSPKLATVQLSDPDGPDAGYSLTSDAPSSVRSAVAAKDAERSNIKSTHGNSKNLTEELNSHERDTRLAVSDAAIGAAESKTVEPPPGKKVTPFSGAPEYCTFMGHGRDGTGYAMKLGRVAPGNERWLSIPPELAGSFKPGDKIDSHVSQRLKQQSMNSPTPNPPSRSGGHKKKQSTGGSGR